MTGFEDFGNLPTLMDIDLEIEVISKLMGMPEHYIAEHVDEFNNLIGDLVDSHGGSAYFQLTPENEGAFQRFADWLEPMLAKFGDEHSEIILNVFRTTSQDVHDAYFRSWPNPTKELQAFSPMPRVMRASVELAAIRKLRAIPLEQLAANREEFTDIVETLNKSHGDPKGGLDGLTPHNESQFHDFAAWLREIAPQLGWPTGRDWSFDMTFEQAAKKHRNLRQKAALGAQPGSPVVSQLAQRVKEADALEILGVGTHGDGINLVGRGWGFVAGHGWRVLDPDRTLAFAWCSPAVEDEAAGLVGLHVVEVTTQSTATACDPTLHLSDGRSLEIFTADPLAPWSMRIANVEFTGAPTAPEWV